MDSSKKDTVGKISIHALHEESDPDGSLHHDGSLISIHALHEESDRRCRLSGLRVDISIHALHEESDSLQFSRSRFDMSFQSTLSMRRATCIVTLEIVRILISIHALHEESDPDKVTSISGMRISIHALHEESDAAPVPLNTSMMLFQSTLSMRRATLSNHALRAVSSGFQSTLSMRRATVQLDIFVRFLRRKPAA